MNKYAFHVDFDQVFHVTDAGGNDGLYVLSEDGDHLFSDGSRCRRLTEDEVRAYRYLKYDRVWKTIVENTGPNRAERRKQAALDRRRKKA